MKILVTGGLGYIGSCISQSLLKANHTVGIIDDLRTAVTNRSALVGAESIAASIDSKDAHAFVRHFCPDIVMHLAASTNVGEGESKPLEYAQNNIGCLLPFVRACLESGSRKFVFSSSCSVYGSPDSVPVTEAHPTKPMSWYGYTKLIGEEILRREADQGRLKCVALRYFNVVGPSLGPPSDGPLFPRAIAAAVNGTELIINGRDYATKDGTCVRDYIDVRDVAKAHLAAMKWLNKDSEKAWEVVNIGWGYGLSIMDILDAIEKVSRRKIKTILGLPRPGDVPEVFADNVKAKSLLDWEPIYNIEESVRDYWNTVFKAQHALS